MQTTGAGDEHGHDDRRSRRNAGNLNTLLNIINHFLPLPPRALYCSS
jgi:hypothetical protein